MLSLVALCALGLCLIALGRPALVWSEEWRATITPLASIIGSGFLVAVPLLAVTVGPWAPIAMAVIAAYAFAVGWAIRLNIAHAESLLASRRHLRLRTLERLSRIALGVAYVISVAFYLRLLAAFLLRPLDIDGEVPAAILTTVILMAIALIGVVRGLNGLESVEMVAVTVKLGVIAALLAGLGAFLLLSPGELGTGYGQATPDLDLRTVIQTTAGLLLVVQGFETSRYLGRRYSAGRRVRSMRRAQMIAAFVYVAFAALAVPHFDELPGRVDETAVIDIAVAVAVVLGPLVLLAAVASQVSAAVADTVGGGEMLLGRATQTDAAVGYVTVTAGAAVVVWLTDVFELIALASRAFAAYYLLQVLIAVGAVALTPSLTRRRGRFVALGALAASLAGVILFARPVA